MHNQEAPNNGVVLEFGSSTSWAGQLYIGDNATQGIYYNGWSNGVRGSWRRLADVPVSLYDNSSGTTGTVTLSESSANFSYLEIFFVSYSHKSARVYNPNGKEVKLQSVEYADTQYDLWKTVTISGTNITVKNEYRIADYGNTLNVAQNTNQVRIYKVIGYR